MLLRDVQEWISDDRDDVSELARLYRSDLVLPSHQLGSCGRRGADGLHRRPSEVARCHDLSSVMPLIFGAGRIEVIRDPHTKFARQRDVLPGVVQNILHVFVLTEIRDRIQPEKEIAFGGHP